MYLIEILHQSSNTMLHHSSSTEPVVKYNEHGEIVGMDWSPIDKRDKQIFFNWKYIVFIKYHEIKVGNASGHAIIEDPYLDVEP